jgi:predicted amidohydrolase
MAMASAPPRQTHRLAIAQIEMHWDIAANANAIKAAMRIAKAEGATLCAFSELALTGFHRRIVEQAHPEFIAPALQDLQALAASLGLAVALGAPTFGGGGERFNSHLLVQADGSLVAEVQKNGLTDPEATFFSRGSHRPVARLAGIACTAVICREIADLEHVSQQLDGLGAEVILWPGQMRPDPAKPVQDPPAHVVQAQQLAATLKAFVVQTNWPNALNRPEESAQTGHSACISPDGELLFRLPMQGRGLAVFDLGERVYAWHPSAS